MYCVCDNIVYVAFKELCKNLCDAVVITVIIVATSNQFTMQAHYFLELTAVFFACLSSFYPLLFPIAHYFLCVLPMCLCFVYALGLGILLAVVIVVGAVVLLLCFILLLLPVCFVVRSIACICSMHCLPKPSLHSSNVTRKTHTIL